MISKIIWCKPILNNINKTKKILILMKINSRWINNKWNQPNKNKLNNKIWILMIINSNKLVNKIWILMMIQINMIINKTIIKIWILMLIKINMIVKIMIIIKMVWIKTIKITHIIIWLNKPMIQLHIKLKVLFSIPLTIQFKTILILPKLK